MSRFRKKFLVALLALFFLRAGIALAQEAAEHPAAASNKSAETATSEEGGGANAGVAQILAATTEQAAHTAENWGRRLGLGKDTSFGISLAVNFGGIILFCYLLMKGLPRVFRQRTATIQKGIQEAQAASADASRRLTDIETRLSKLDAEVAEIRQVAEHEAAAEEERVREAAEQDKQRIVEGAKAEIESMSRNAQRELKGYAASLAVDLAARRLQVDESTDHALVRDFVEQLGKDGH